MPNNFGNHSSGFGDAVLSAQFRATPEDFRVDEVLGFEADGSGEHLLLDVEKRAANTLWVARQLARWAGVADMAVGFAGLKDRHAVTRQTFSIHLPGREAPSEDPQSGEFRVLSRQRHRRKLQRGALRGNRFELCLRGVRGERAAIEQRLAQVAAGGMPNYFGAQRFGRDGGNLDAARAMFAGRRVRREERSILLSAVRSAGFNAVLAARIEQGNWNQAIEGEVFMLDGSHSVFGPQPIDDALRARTAGLDVHPTGPLWGQGELRSTLDARTADEAARCIGEDLLVALAGAGLRQERRALRVRVGELGVEWIAEDALRLRFFLPSGSYATALLNAIGDVREIDVTNGTGAGEPEE